MHRIGGSWHLSKLPDVLVRVKLVEEAAYRPGAELKRACSSGCKSRDSVQHILSSLNQYITCAYILRDDYSPRPPMIRTAGRVSGSLVAAAVCSIVGATPSLCSGFVAGTSCTASVAGASAAG